MIKFAHYNEVTGELLGWYSKDIHGENIPTPNKEVSEVAWERALGAEANHVNKISGELTKKELRSAEEVLESVGKEKFHEIKKDFEEASKSFTTSFGYTMDADIDRVARLKSGLDLANLVGSNSLEIRDYNNETHTVDLITVNSMVLELGINAQTQLQKKWLAQDQIKAAISPQEVRLISF